MVTQTKVKEALEGFEKYLVDNTVLAPKTILVYVNEIRYYFRKHTVFNGNTIIRHIVKQHKDSNNNVSKYALKHFLKYIGREKDVDVVEILNKLPALKTPDRKRINRQISPENILRILANIAHPVYRDIASLQLATGARSSEIITLRHENFDLGNLTAMITGKGKKTGYIQFAEHLRPILQKYVRNEKGYLFLPDKLVILKKEDPIEYQRQLKRFNDNYYQQVRQAGLNSGISPFGTHDLRRAFSQEFYKAKPDIVALKEALRHSRITTTVIYLPPFNEEVQSTIKSVQDRFKPK